VSFTYDRNKNAIVDPATGDVLRLIFAHRQADYKIIGIFSADGVKKFSARLKVRTIDPLQSATDNVMRWILTSAVEYDANGRPTLQYGHHPDIDRLVEFDRAYADRWQIPFEFVDERKRPLPLDQEELQVMAKAAGWKQAKKTSPRSSC
jgi:hypothetical protein